MATYENELVTRSAPRWAWDALDEAISTACELGEDSAKEYGRAHSAMMLACELANDEPIAPDDPRLNQDEDELWRCPNCDEHLQDGSGVCITCGQKDEDY